MEQRSQGGSQRSKKGKAHRSEGRWRDVSESPWVPTTHGIIARRIAADAVFAKLLFASNQM
jgi:hypothetical protein